MKFSIKDFYSKYDQIRWKLQIWSRLLKKSLKKKLHFCAVLKVSSVANISQSTTNVKQFFYKM